MSAEFSRQFVGFNFASDLALPAMKGCGQQYIDSHDYFWENRGRNHHICLIQYCISGEGTVEVGNLLHPVLPGDVFIIHIPGESRYYLPEHSSQWEVLFLEFTEECLPFVQKIYRTCGPVVHLSEESGFPGRLLGLYEKALKNELQTIFENSKAAFELWMDLIAYVLATYTTSPSKIDQIKAYMDQHYQEPDISLDHISVMTGISKYHLCREFQKKFGTSPGRYIKDLRLKQACRLLTLNSGYTMNDIAQMVGYTNNNYFGKVFKAAKGVSPEKFRRESTQYDFVRTVAELPE